MTTQRNVKSHEKIGLVVFLVIGLTTFVFAYIEVKRSIALPFVRKTNVTFKSSDQIEQERTDLLKKSDTDKDGLSDYDELYIYRTSPFLADSDSDGIPDGVEVANGTDPNCPQGRSCRQAPVPGSGSASPPPPGSTVTATPTNQVEGAIANSNTPPGAGGPNSVEAEQRAAKAIADTFGDPSTLTKEQVTAKLQTMSSAELRSFLVEMGIPEGALQKADDATLKKLLQDALNEIVSAGQGSGTSSSGAPATNAQTGGTNAAQ